MDNLKQFLEADALRTQWECMPLPLEETAWDKAFIAAASRIAPDIRQLLAAFEQVCEVIEERLESCQQTSADGFEYEWVTKAKSLLTAAAPYRKLMGGV